MKKRDNKQNLQERVAQLSKKADVPVEELTGCGRIYELSSLRKAVYAILYLDGYKVSEIADCFNRTHPTVVIGIDRIMGLNEIGDRATHEMFVKLLTD